MIFSHKEVAMTARKHRLPGLILFLTFLAGLLPACTQLDNAIPENGILINEVVASNKRSLTDAAWGSPDWIELYNGSQIPVDLSGWYLTDNVENEGKLSPLPKRKLAPGEYLILYANGESAENCLDFSLSRKGETLTLVNPRREAVTTLEIPALVKDVSYARRSDGSYGFCPLPTPGKENTGDILDVCPASSLLVKDGDEKYAGKTYEALRLTEILSRGELVWCESCGRYVDAIELYNPGLVTVNLEGYTLTSREGKNREHNLPAAELDGQKYMTLWGCSEGCQPTDGHVCLDFGLSRYGEGLYLYDPLGTLLDQVQVPEMEKNVTWARRADDTWGYCQFPTLGKENRSEDILDTPPSPQDGAARADTATMGTLAVSINEACAKNTISITDRDGDRSDFCELYNHSNTAVSLKEWYLSDDPEKLTKWALPDVTMEPETYLIVFLSGKESSEHELHASFSLSVGETLTLYCQSSNMYEALRIPEVPEGASAGMEEGALVYYLTPTPGYANGHPWLAETQN